jgi:TonB family protein
MDNFVFYLLKVSAGISLFYLCYLLLFRKDKFFQRNRIFLIVTLLLPAIIPFLNIPEISKNVTSVTTINVLGNNTLSEAIIKTSGSATNSTFDFFRLFTFIYFPVTGLILFRVVISLISTYKIISKGTIINNEFPKVVVSDKNLPPFSFYPYAVIPEEDYKNGDISEILDHETAHIRGRHTFDLLLSELFVAFQWFNPFVWFIKSSIILNHEYLADCVSLSKIKSAQAYQYRLLNFQTELNTTSLAHSFNSFTKNRIVMINKKTTPRLANLKTILILPVLAFVLIAFTKPNINFNSPFDASAAIFKSQENSTNEINGIVVQSSGKPLKGATVVVMGTTVGTSTDSNGHFRLINVPEDATLVVSYVGYKSAVEKANFKSDMNISMTRSIVNTEKVSINPPSQLPETDESMLVIVEEMPMYPGGEDAMSGWIASKVIYPKEALKNNVKGVVYVNFIVSASGKVKNVQVQKPVHPLLDAEAIRVISKMPAWKPASQNGIAVDVDYMVPVEFK